jgi:hypothetical protein
MVAMGAMAASAANLADDLARCADIKAPETRLACYDALAHKPAAGKLSAAPAVAPSAPAPSNPATATAASPTPNPNAAFADDPKNFGLTPAQQHLTDLGPKSIGARIARLQTDSVGHTTIVLDSGQAWTVADNDGWLSKGDQVTIKRAALGSYLMTTRANHSYPVQRIH